MSKKINIMNPKNDMPIHNPFIHCLFCNNTKTTLITSDIHPNGKLYICKNCYADIANTFVASEIFKINKIRFKLRI